MIYYRSFTNYLCGLASELVNACVGPFGLWSSCGQDLREDANGSRDETEGTFQALSARCTRDGLPSYRDGGGCALGRQLQWSWLRGLRPRRHLLLRFVLVLLLRFVLACCHVHGRVHDHFQQLCSSPGLPAQSRAESRADPCVVVLSFHCVSLMSC